jgi:hypothetical protein
MELTRTDTDVEVVDIVPVKQITDVTDVQLFVLQTTPPTNMFGVASTVPKLKPDTVKLAMPDDARL